MVSTHAVKVCSRRFFSLQNYFNIFWYCAKLRMLRAFDFVTQASFRIGKINISAQFQIWCDNVYLEQSKLPTITMIIETRDYRLYSDSDSRWRPILLRSIYGINNSQIWSTSVSLNCGNHCCHRDKLGSIFSISFSVSMSTFISISNEDCDGILVWDGSFRHLYSR